MNIKTNDYFELGNEKYITINDCFYESDKYIFVNQLNEIEEPTEMFKIFKCLDEGLVLVKDEQTTVELLKIFEKEINDKLLAAANA